MWYIFFQYYIRSRASSDTFTIASKTNGDNTRFLCTRWAIKGWIWIVKSSSNAIKSTGECPVVFVWGCIHRTQTRIMCSFSVTKVLVAPNDICNISDSSRTFCYSTILDDSGGVNVGFCKGSDESFESNFLWRSLFILNILNHFLAML